MGLYHYKIGMPKGFSGNVGTVSVTYTRHAHEAAQSDRYGTITLPRTLDTRHSLCIELELTEGRPTKLVYRTSYSATLDLILVCVPVQGHFKVLTVWLNLKSDKHETLNVSKYEAA